MIISLTDLTIKLTLIVNAMVIGLPQTKPQSSSELIKLESKLNVNNLMSSDSSQRSNGSKLFILTSNRDNFTSDLSARDSANYRHNHHRHKHRHNHWHHHRGNHKKNHRSHRSHHNRRKHHSHHRHKRLRMQQSNLKNLLLNINLDNPMKDDYMKQLSFKSFENLKSDSDSKHVISTASNFRKKDWCKTLTLKHKIVEKDCLPKMVINKYCYGQCNSFFIPSYSFDVNSNSTKVEPAFKTCSLCRPKKFQSLMIRLYCPSLSPPFKIRQVQLIEKCKCLNDPSLV